MAEPLRHFLIAFLITLPTVVSSETVVIPSLPFIKHYLGVETLWKARMGYYTHDELNDFVKATWLGTYENQKLVKALASISILECKPEPSQVPVRNRTGHLGGHRTTIRVGAKECGCGYGTPYLRTLALSRHFMVLYNRFGKNLEKTCRVWNMGPKWKNEKATRYWNGVVSFSKIYENDEPVIRE